MNRIRIILCAVLAMLAPAIAAVRTLEQTLRGRRAWTWQAATAAFVCLALIALFLPHNPDSMSALGVIGVGMAGAIMDSRAEFCDATALNTGGAGAYLLGNVLDSTVVRDLGNGQPVYLVISVDTAATSGGAATVQFVLASDSVAAIAADGTETRHWTSFAIPVATLVAGYQLAVALPPESPAYERYVGVEMITAVAAFTAGKINAYLTLSPPATAKTYANAANS